MRGLLAPCRGGTDPPGAARAARAARRSRLMGARRVRWVLLGLAMLAGSPAWGATVSVLAAASLTEAFRTIGKDFEAAHPGTKVEFNFAGSSTLARQIVEGAPADVFASADGEKRKKC